MIHKQQLLPIIYLLTILNSTFTQEDSAETLGKTHFIVGYTEDKKITPQSAVAEASAYVPPSQSYGGHSKTTSDTKAGRPQINHTIPYNLMCDDCVKSVYFSPDDDVRSILLYLIAQETKYIHIAMFNFTEKKLAQALVNAQARGIQVEVIVDQGNIYSPYNKLSLLHQGHVQLFVYNAHCIQKRVPSLMHNKFIVFGNNILGKSVVCTGSFNFTRAAHRNNQENVLILDDSVVVDKYEKKFEQLKKCSDYYQQRRAVKQGRKS